MVSAKVKRIPSLSIAFLGLLVAGAPVGEIAGADDPQLLPFQLEDFAKEKDDLYLHGAFSNVLKTGDGAAASTVIEGVLFQGDFFPQVVLAVAPNKEGPLPAGSAAKLVLPGYMEARPLKISLKPFLNELRKTRWGKITLVSTGDALVFELSKAERALKFGSQLERDK